MIRLIIEKELREIVGSAKFALSFAVCSLLILISFYVGAGNYSAWTQQYDAARGENLRQLDGLTDWFSVQQTKIFLPPQPLAALVSGISNDIGRTVEVRGRGELIGDDSRYNEEPVFAVFRFLDLEFIFQIVLSLFAILFAYDSISGEKERGTLKLTFANPVPNDLYIVGKILGSALALGFALIIPILAGSLLLPLLGVHMKSEEWIRLGLIAMAGMLYFGAFLSLSILVSCVTRKSSHSFLILLVIWMFSVMIIPRGAVLLAGRAVSVPSVDETASRKNMYSSQLWSEDRKTMAAFNAGTDQSEPEKIMQRFNAMMQSIADEREKKMAEFAERINEERSNKQREQQDLALSIARISPSAALSLAVSSLAGTSLDLERHYLDAAADYQKEFAKFIKSKTGMVSGGRMIMMRSVVEDGKKPEPINPHELPSFSYKPLALSDQLGPAIVNMGIVALFSIVCFGLSYASFKRYDVR